MMSEPKSPIIAYSDGLLCIFENAQTAISYVEPWDVVDGLWTAWSSDGRVLELIARSDRDQVQLRPTSLFDEVGLVETLTREMNVDPNSVGDPSPAKLIQSALVKWGFTT